MNVLATGDVNSSVLAAFRDELSADLDVVLDEHRIMLRSAEPSSWIQFFADAPWWMQTLGAYAAIYVSEIVREAGKDTWKQKGRLVDAALSGADRLAKLAAALARVRAGLPDRTRLVLGLPVPDDYLGIRFELQGCDEEVLAVEIALFVRHLPGLETLIEKERLKEGKVTGAVKLMPLENGSMSVSWMDRTSLTIVERVLPLPDDI